MNTYEWLVANKSKFESREDLVDGCINSMKVTRRSVLNHISKVWPSDYIQNRKSVKRKKSSSGMNRTQLLEKFDINTKLRSAIRKGIATLTEEPNPEEDGTIEDIEFRMERCESHNAIGFRKIAEEPEFHKYQFKISDKVFWTTPRNKKWALENIRTARDI